MAVLQGALPTEGGGVNLKVITRNTDVFTAGFESVNEEGIPQFTYIAPTYHITIDIER